MDAQRKGKTKRKKRSRQTDDKKAEEAILQTALYDWTVRHGDRFVAFSDVRDRPQAIAKLSVPVNEEISRHWHVHHLRRVLDETIANKKAILGLFERWLWHCSLDPSRERAAASAKLASFDFGDEEITMPIDDPVIPNVDLGLTQLTKELRSNETIGDPQSDGAIKLDEQQIADRFREELIESNSQMSALRSKGSANTMEFPLEIHDTEVLANKVKLALQPAYKQKLLGLYKMFGDSEGEGFDKAVAAMLLRYDAIWGPLFQVSLPPDVFRVLKKQFGVFLECFASPMNSFFPRYCSAFPDTDCCFGSLGSFFGFVPQDGSFEAFPPQTPQLITATLHHIEDILVQSSKALSFILVVHCRPSSDLESCDKSITGSNFFAGKLTVRAREHSLCEGFQHRKTHLLHLALLDTTLYFLQNEAGKTRWPLTPENERKLRNVFAGRSEDYIEPEPAPVPKKREEVERELLEFTNGASSNWEKLKTKIAPEKKKIKTGGKIKKGHQGKQKH